MKKISIDSLISLIYRSLQTANYSDEEIEYIAQNLLFAEMSNKKTHGIIRIPYLIESANSKKITTGAINLQILKETPISLLVDGQNRTGLYIINKSLDRATQKAKQSGVCILALTNTAPISGVIGQYAQKATDEDLVLIGFNNSSGGLAPFGSIDSILGTNPFTVGVPSNTFPVILDMASSKTTFGNILLAKALGQEIPKDVAIDKDGNPTQSPESAIDGSLLPFENHKGSGLGVVVELLAGALTNSRCGFNKQGGWGSLFILINPDILIDTKEFKANVDSLISEIKTSRKMKGFNEILLPGEKSYYKRVKSMKNGEVEVDEKILEQIEKYLD